MYVYNAVQRKKYQTYTFQYSNESDLHLALAVLHTFTDILRPPTLLLTLDMYTFH